MNSITLNNRTPPQSEENRIRQIFGDGQIKSPTAQSTPVKEEKINLDDVDETEIEMSSPPSPPSPRSSPPPRPLRNEKISSLPPDLKWMKRQLKKRMKSLQKIQNPTMEEMLEWLVLNNLKKKSLFLSID